MNFCSPTVSTDLVLAVLDQSDSLLLRVRRRLRLQGRGRDTKSIQLAVGDIETVAAHLTQTSSPSFSSIWHL